MSIKEGNNVTIDLSNWDVIRRRYHINATINIVNSSDILVNKEFQYLPHYQETRFSIMILEFSIEVYALEIIIENPDGIKAVENISFTVSALIPSSNLAILIFIGGLFLHVKVFIYRKR
ncbi:MAG: hypothetical protein ACFFFH_18435 [Candidatus Thorarchaeota archaeon]